ncbi:hypothetical protein LAZ67_1006850 [Cordylochernes scorpioides]|uniref:DUF5641 domain-containing protein n=1 Tax=Cordylochernes scorpioides TaxID=51811 RepID=A0ABY6K215_9ARAC|nr:hypothetical protein LAZ67_1006850 [Cordylochernes scorpioides]
MDNKKRNFLPLAVIEEILFGRDGVNRLVKVKTAVGTFLRPIQKIYPLEISSTAASSRWLNDKEKTAKIQTRSGRTLGPHRLVGRSDVNLSWHRLAGSSTCPGGNSPPSSPCRRSRCHQTDFSPQTVLISRRTNPLQADRYLCSFLHYGTI